MEYENHPSPYGVTQASLLEDTRDAEHLQLLAIFHYVVAGIVGLFSLFPLIHLVMGVLILTGSFVPGSGTAPPPAFFGWMLVILPAVFILGGLTLAGCIATTGRNLQRRRGHLFCMVVAGIECMFIPLGTVLGVLTIVVLLRPSVKQLFGVADHSGPAPITKPSN